MTVKKLRVERNRCCLHLFLLLMGGLPACSIGVDTGSTVRIDNARMRVPMESTRMSAGYGTFVNNSDRKVTIVEASSDSIATIEFHESVLVEGMVRMNKLEELVINPNESLILSPGAKHLMFIGIQNTEQKEHAIKFLRQNGETFSELFPTVVDVH